MKNRIILFRFHTRPAVCRNRIELLRLFNPGTDIVGLYGGDEEQFPRFSRVLGDKLDALYCIRGKSQGWKWKNGDLAVRLWYRDQGHRIPFDMVHVVEWDLLLFSPMAEVFGHVSPDAVSVAKLRSVKGFEGEWVWVTNEPHRSQWLELLCHARETYGYAAEPYSCNFVGASLPRAFLERCSGVEIPQLVNDEARLPLYAQIFGFNLVDNLLYVPARQDERRYFNLVEEDIPDDVIFREILKKNGRRVFHPYNKVYHRLTTGGFAYNAFYYFMKRLMKYSKRRRFSSTADIA